MALQLIRSLRSIARRSWVPLLVIGIGVLVACVLAPKLVPNPIRDVAASVLPPRLLPSDWAEEPDAPPKVEPIPVVSAVPVIEHSGNVDIVVDGVVVPYREIEIASEVAGKVIEKSDRCRPGNYVHEGDVLLEIDKADYEIEFNRLEELFWQNAANLEEYAWEKENVDEMLKLSAEEVALRTTERNRFIDLKNKNATSQNTVDAAEQRLLTAKIQQRTQLNIENLLASKQSRLMAAQAIADFQLQQAKLDLARTKIQAPASGVLISVLPEQGDYITKGSTIIQMEDTSKVEVKCNLEMEDMYWLWHQSKSGSTEAKDRSLGNYQIPQTPVTIVYQLANHADVRYRWKGMLKRYDGLGLDEATRTVPCRVVVDNPQEVYRNEKLTEFASSGPRALVRGMFVTIRIHVEPDIRIIRIPESAMLPGKKVGIVREGEYHELNNVRTVSTVEQATGDRVTRYWLIEADESAIRVDDQIVTSAALGVTDGTQVLVSDTTADRLDSSQISTPLAGTTEAE